MISRNIEEVIKEIKKYDAEIVCATKYASVSDLKALREKGLLNFGENRVDTFLSHYEEMKEYEDIIWHFIGHLQTNKVSVMINKIKYIHSLDSFHLASYINKYRFQPLDCFVQLNLCDSKTKFGFKENEVFDFLESIKEFKKVNVVGLMTMVDEDLNDYEIEDVFLKLKDIQNKLNGLGYNIKYLSAGMSNDYQIALKCGSTHVRLGRKLFE